ncbi:MAG: phosphoribosylformylglycinamidine synthase subunit PurQ [Fusobacteriaceae bacterium]|nr:phosphoribosylformylglycinamidine synthase subunit PurQ [Fusobacteriaceae bacterium]
MKKILIPLFKGVEILEVSPFIDVFGWNNILNKETILVHTIADFSPIECCWNLKIIPEIIFKNSIDLNEYSAIVFPGGFGSKGFFKSAKSSDFCKYLKNYATIENNIFLQETFFVGVCTGSLILLELGLLKNKRATTYLRENGRYFNQLFESDAIPTKQEIVIDGRIITSSGPSTALKTAFYLLESLTNKENTLLVKKEMGFDI